MNKNVLKNYLHSLAFGLVAATSFAWADQQLIPANTMPKVDQLGHVFAHACFASQPALIERNAKSLETAFFFTRTDTSDADAQWISTDGNITVTVDGNPISTTCIMNIPAEIGKDGADIYDGLVAHLPDAAQNIEAEAIDGGLAWKWDRNDVNFTLNYTEADGDFTLSFKAER